MCFCQKRPCAENLDTNKFFLFFKNINNPRQNLRQGNKLLTLFDQGEGGGGGGGVDLRPIVFNQGKTNPFQTAISREVTEIPKMGHILEELNFRPFFEQVNPSRISGESFGADLPPTPGS